MVDGVERIRGTRGGFTVCTVRVRTSCRSMRTTLIIFSSSNYLKATTTSTWAATGDRGPPHASHQKATNPQQTKKNYIYIYIQYIWKNRRSTRLDTVVLTCGSCSWCPFRIYPCCCCWLLGFWCCVLYYNFSAATVFGWLRPQRRDSDDSYMYIYSIRCIPPVCVLVINHHNQKQHQSHTPNWTWPAPWCIPTLSPYFACLFFFEVFDPFFSSFNQKENEERKWK